MKSFVFGWLVGFGLLLNLVGCCSMQMAGNGCGVGGCGVGGCGVGGCGNMGCAEMAPFGGIRERIANRIRSTHCSSGCGEIYWDEHINEPPVCDPCGCDGEFTGETCGSCPTLFGRLRNLWGYHYYPSNCDSCSSCGGGGFSTGTSHCSSCSTGGNSWLGTSDSMHNPSGNSLLNQPAPSSSPIHEATPRLQSVPTPDPNAMYRNGTSSRLTVGSGVTTHDSQVPSKVSSQRVVKAQPVASKSTQSVQGRPRLVTNPR